MNLRLVTPLVYDATIRGTQLILTCDCGPTVTVPAAPYLKQLDRTQDRSAWAGRLYRKIEKNSQFGLDRSVATLSGNRVVR